MDKKQIASWCLIAGILILIAAVVVRIGNSLVFSLPLRDLWKLSVILVLISIAFNTSKD